MIQEVNEKILESKVKQTHRKPLDVNDFYLLSSIPGRHKYTASEVMDKLKQRGDLIKLYSNGRVTFFGNELVKESNITDLLNYAVRDTGFSQANVGTNRLLAICKTVNIPSHLLCRNVGRDWFGNGETIPMRDTYTESAKKK